MAQCATSGSYKQLNQSDIESLVGLGTACYPAGGPPWTNQEYHTSSGASGTIIDYKKGPSDPRDPSKAVGTYTVNADSTITYNYTVGGTYTYSVWGKTNGKGATYDFCVGSTPLPGGVRIISGSGAC
jgi:hypothetical protein